MVRQTNNSGLVSKVYMERQAKSGEKFCLGIQDKEIKMHIKGGPEPLEKESHEFLGSKRDDRFSNPFFEMVPKTC